MEQNTSSDYKKNIDFCNIAKVIMSETSKKAFQKPRDVAVGVWLMRFLKH